MTRPGPRRFTRIPIRAAAALVTPDGRVTDLGVATDISVGGVFIETERTAAAGTRVLLRLSLMGNADPVVIGATVRWSNDRGMGLQFGSLRASRTTEVVDDPPGDRFAG